MKPIIALIAGLTIATAAQAQIRQMPYALACGPVESFTKHVTQKYKESVVGRGFASNGKVMVQIWAAESGSFTITMQPAGSGTICVLTSGQEWQDIEPKRGDRS